MKCKLPQPVFSKPSVEVTKWFDRELVRQAAIRSLIYKGDRFEDNNSNCKPPQKP